MNRTHWQAIAILMGTIATMVIAAEWRWEPASAGNYLVLVETNAAAPPDENAASAVQQRR
ncbi:hypothetical protein [Pseudoduganella umbonata]|uniref:Uncharacterized protein n=1 Tax=Pseudoduganella umbonata TaxID=864828 RepID=A0A4P8HUC2_9BURK|nr:hypothetical protein [Pseudoduganella umbonata]MBB3225290.1 hypothetical protein [Pseudoduganella umbonata]QCP12886.1 hypothetical protein FCL38_22410 [Pseudoduganella umbonata]